MKKSSVSKYIYSEIRLDGESFSNYKDIFNKNVESLQNLSKVNIFVGSNNSGKSRFLRELMKIQDYYFNSRPIETKKYLEYIREISHDLKRIKEADANHIDVFSIQGHGQFNESDFRDLDLEYYDFSENLDSLLRMLKAFKESSFQMNAQQYRGSGSMNQFQLSIQRYFDNNEEKINFVLSFNIKKIDFKKNYIPILRSLNNFHSEINGEEARDKKDLRDFYNQRIAKNYGIESEKNIKVFTGQKLYFEIRDMLLGNSEARKKIASYERFLSEELFNSQSVSLIPKAGSDVLHIKIGNDEKAIYDLGDGIQSLIILTFQLFMVDDGLFFIEEPELHLHPGMQRKFLETILKKDGHLSSKNHQYFITTHSNHFLDLTLDYGDISIYKFSSDTVSTKLEKIIEQVNFGNENVLKDLGVKNSSVFLTNATIWVEGITDRLYIRKFLELYQDHFPDKEAVYEDVDYSFVEYGGNNITHWSFLESDNPTICVDRLCGKSLLVTDKDGENKIERQKELKRKLGRSRYICLDCREIENALSLRTLEKTIKKYPSERNFVMPRFRSEYPQQNKKIGTFIQNRLKPNNEYRDKSGTLLSGKKLDFCNKAIEDMKYEDMTLVAIKLARKIYKFVIEQKR